MQCCSRFFYYILVVCSLVLLAGPSFAQHVDTNKQIEHHALLALVPDSAVSHRVAASGLWSAASSWQSGRLPNAGANVLVPAGMTLTVDVLSDIRLRTIRVDGVIKFDTRKNTRLTVDTLVVTPQGTFEVGSEARPLSAQTKVEIIISRNGPIDTNWD